MANQADLPVRTLCRVLGVSASGFYAWRERAPSQRSVANAVMTERIRQIHKESYESYGMPRVRFELMEQGERISAWLGEGRDVALLIGGPDGLDPSHKASADETLRLSDLTLPHAFARVLLAEALYRGWTLATGHPYHRE